MNEQTDLTTGGILQRLVFVAVPIMGTQLIQMLYNLTDMFWLGRLSSDSVAASGAAGMYLWLSMSLMMFGRMGAEIGVSQNKGRRDMKTAQAFAQNACFLSLLLGILYGSALIFFSGPLVSFFSIQEQQVAAASASYLRIVGLGVPANYLAAAVAGMFTGAGNSRIPFYMVATGLVLNIILDPLMIFTLRLGIEGAAIATMLAQWVVAGLLIYTAQKHRNRPFAQFKLRVRPRLDILAQIFRWSFPVVIESAVFTVLSMTVTRVVTGFGSGALAVQRVGSQIESLSWLIGGGFGSAVTAFMGQNFGAAKWERINQGFRISSAAMLIWGTVVTLALFFGGYSLISLFLMDEGLRSMGAVYLKILASCQMIACLEAVGAGFFRGVGRTVPPSGVSILSNAARVPLCYWLAATPLGINGVWWGITTTALLRGAVVYVWSVLAKRK